MFFDSTVTHFFPNRYYYYLLTLMTLVLPIGCQLLLAGDCLLDAFLLSVVMRNVSVYHDTAFVNSAAHMFGDRPYNADIEPSENYFVSLASFGEGYHNYHHSFPWDYKAGEYSAGFNLTTLFLDCMYGIGQAYNMRVASEEVVQGSKTRTAATATDHYCYPVKGSFAARLGADFLEADLGAKSGEESAAADQLIDRRTISSWATEVIKNRKLTFGAEESCEFL